MRSSPVPRGDLSGASRSRKIQARRQKYDRGQPAQTWSGCTGDPVRVGEIALPCSTPRTKSTRELIDPGSETAPRGSPRCRNRRFRGGGKRRRRIIPPAVNGLEPVSFRYRARIRSAIAEGDRDNPFLSPRRTGARRPRRRTRDVARLGRRRLAAASIRAAILSEGPARVPRLRATGRTLGPSRKMFLLAGVKRGLEYGPSLNALRGDSIEKRGRTYGNRL
jgi:hypothetical protein